MIMLKYVASRSSNVTLMMGIVDDMFSRYMFVSFPSLRYGWFRERDRFSRAGKRYGSANEIATEDSLEHIPF